MRHDKDEILEFVRERMAAGESISSIAKSTPVSHTTIHRWLQGERPLSTTTIKRMDNRLRVNELRKDGTKLTEIAERLGLSLRTVNRHVNDTTKTARKVEREKNKQWVLEQYYRGLSLREISEIPGCPVDRETVTRWVREHRKAA